MSNFKSIVLHLLIKLSLYVYTGATFYKTIKISLGCQKRLDWFKTNEIKVEKLFYESFTQILTSHWVAQIE